jgi:hypothetical protein
MAKEEEKREEQIGAQEIVLGIIVLAALVFGGYQLLTKVVFNSADSKQNVQLVSAKVPEDWKQFGNTGLGISFAYPQDWKLTQGAKKTAAGTNALAKLEAPDGTNLSITLIHIEKGKADTSLNNWKDKATQAGLEYTDLWEIQSPYTAFGYNWNEQGTEVLSYEVLGETSSASMTVLPATTAQKALIEQLVGTIRFAQPVKPT